MPRFVVGHKMPRLTWIFNDHAMIAFEVHLNGRKICTAGVGEVGVLTACLAWRGSEPYEKGSSPVAEYLRLDVGGLSGNTGEHVRWKDRKLKRKDVVSIKIIEAGKVDKPREQQRHDPVKDLRRKKNYVRQMAREFGWKILT